MADLGVGLARTIVQDRAYDASWFMLCPRLAQIVNHIVVISPSLTQSPAEAGSSPEQTSARRADAAASSAGQASSRLLLAETMVRSPRCDVIFCMLP